MRLAASHLAELAAELGPWLAGARVRDVQGLPPKDAILVFEPAEEGGAVRRLRVSAEAETGRLHAQRGRAPRHKGPIGPFFRTLAEALLGQRLRRLEPLRGDRIVRLVFERSELVLELLGRHGNLVLLDGSERVRDVLVPPGAGSRAAERLTAGEPWRAPSGRGAPPPSVPPLSEVLGPVEGGADLPLSAAVEAALGGEAGERRTAELRADLERRLVRRRRGAVHLIEGLERRRAAAGEAERVRMDGELLQAARDRLRRGQEEIEVDDWFVEGTPRRTIALDPKLAPAQNVERFFASYRKKLRALERVPAELELARADLAALDELAARLAEPEADPEALEAEALERRLLTPKQAPPERRRAPAPRRPYLRFTGCRGSEIRVGRTARDNDALTFRESRGSDLWLHTADAPGSHVILRATRGREPDPEEVLDAAHLALHFSPLRGARKADIHVAERKLVRKPKRAPAGLVVLSGGRILGLRAEPERLERLLATRRTDS